MKASFSSAAERDVKRALDYYKREAGASIALDLVAQIEAKIKLILANPLAYQIVTRDLRCVNLRSFPYQIVYRIGSTETIRIVSLRHHRQHPDFGLKR